tara:strand:+ start:106 stop:678 length:573 start_codon:yes stop_codon:yes gene_type:complete
MFSILGASEPTFKNGSYVYLNMIPSRSQITIFESENEALRRQELIKKHKLLKKGLLGKIVKVDKKKKTWSVKFDKSLNRKDSLKNNFTYVFSHVNIKNILIQEDSEDIPGIKKEIKEHKDDKKKTKKLARDKKVKKRQDKVNTPSMEKEIMGAVDILDHAVKNLDKASLQDLSDEITELNEFIDKELSEM